MSDTNPPLNRYEPLGNSVTLSRRKRLGPTQELIFGQPSLDDGAVFLLRHVLGLGTFFDRQLTTVSLWSVCGV